MPKYNFNLRTASAEDPTPINFVIRWGNRRLVYPARETIAPRYWSRERQRAKSALAFPEHSEFNDRMADIEAKAKATFRTFVTDNGREPDPGELRDAMDIALGRKEDHVPRDLLTFVEGFIERSAHGVNRYTKKPTSRAVFIRNRATLKYLREYVDRSHKGARVPFTTLNTAFVEGFTAYLTKKKGLANNTVRRFICTLRLFLNEAEMSGAEMSRAFRAEGVIPPSEELTGQVYLNEDELNELFHMDLSTMPRLERVRDLFIAGAWIGLRFGDLASVRPEHIEGNTIRINTAKTGTRVTIPVHPIVRAMLTKYGGQLPRALTNQRMNSYLKEICRMVPGLGTKIMIGRTVAGVTREVARPKWELVTTHTMRRSFASNLYRKGIPARTIMAITGHRTEGAFTKYIRLNADEHAAMIADLWNEGTPMLKAV